MIGRFTARRESPAPLSIEIDTQRALPTVPSPSIVEELPAAPAAPAADSKQNPLLTDKFLDAKVRLHRKLIEEINLSALEKLPEDEIRTHVLELVSRYLLLERLPLNAQELSDFVSEI